MPKAQHSSREANSWSTLIGTLFCSAFLIFVTTLNVVAQTRQIARDSVKNLAADEEGRVFWNRFGFSEGGEPESVRRINTTTGLPATLRHGASYEGLAVASPFVFYFEGANLMRTYYSGRLTESVARAVGGPVGGLGTLTAAGDYVYWSDSAGIHRMNIFDGPQQDMLRPTYRAFWLAVDNTHIYWAGGVTGYSEIRRARLSGGPSEQIYWSGTAISNLALDETSIYWSQDGARILRGPKAPFDRPALVYAEARSGLSTRGLVVDRDDIYWTEFRDGTPTGSRLRRSPKDRVETVDLVSGQGIQKLAHDPWNLYWSDAQGINQLPKRPAPAEAALLSIEITQGIQNLNNDVPWVAQKPTIVRVMASVTADPAAPRYTEIVLHGARDGRALPESPLRSLTGVMPFPRPTTARGDVNSTANFVLPASWLSGNVRLTAEINPNLYAFPESDTSNNTIVRDVSFQAKEGMCLVTVPVISHTAPGSIYRITDPTFPSILARFSTIYPNADIRVRELPTPFGPINVSGDAVHTITWLRPWMVYSDVGSCAVSARRVHAGLVSNDANTEGFGGYALPGQVAWVKMMTGGSAPHETPFGGIVMAHEIAHTDWWAHLPGCGAGIPFDYGYPYSGGVLDDGRRSFGTAFDNMLYFGFDRISMSAVPPSAFDFMGYCNPNWISDNHWRELINSFANRSTSRVSDGPASTVNVGYKSYAHATRYQSDLLYLAGIFGKDDSVTWGPTFRVPEQFLTRELVNELMRSAQQRSGQQKSNYSIQLLGADDAVLVTQPFQPIPDTGDLRTPQPDSFSVALPFVPGTTQIRLLKDKKELARINSPGSNAPVVRMLSPKGGEHVTDTLKIAWEIEGGDKSLPPFLVQYSNDGGATWQVLAMNHRVLSLDVPTENLPGGKSCMVRVLASDPFTAAFSVSDPFSVVTHAPFARISSSLAKQTFQTGEQIPVSGFAYDVEDGSLNGKSMHWAIKGIGEIGMGTEALIPDLPPGTYSLILDVVDSEGRKSSTAEEFVIARPSKKKTVPKPVDKK